MVWFHSEWLVRYVWWLHLLNLNCNLFIHYSIYIHIIYHIIRGCTKKCLFFILESSDTSMFGSFWKRNESISKLQPTNMRLLCAICYNQLEAKHRWFYLLHLLNRFHSNSIVAPSLSSKLCTNCLSRSLNIQKKLLFHIVRRQWHNHEDDMQDYWWFWPYSTRQVINRPFHVSFKYNNSLLPPHPVKQLLWLAMNWTMNWLWMMMI